MNSAVPSRDELISRYLDQLPFEPYPVQEEALLAWFESEQGVLVCTPTGTGKTLIAEAAVFEALATGKRVYYTTPLIALCEQKLRELQDSAQKWGYPRESIGLVTGNRRVNPEAPVLVVVAEVLLNRLLSAGQEGPSEDLGTVDAVVMDEFHSFNDPERGVVWELSLGLLPESTRLLLLSATVGNASSFLGWMRASHRRRLTLVTSDQRRVPLEYHWIGEELLGEQIEEMVKAERTPALVFSFHREGCWSAAELLKGKRLVDAGQQELLAEAVNGMDWGPGGGRKLKPLLLRGVGVHHAGILPKYKRAVEELFCRRLLSVVVCTETLAAGVNLPARSVVLTELLKGPPGKKTVIEASRAHQMFGRAGRPQFDDRGDVYVLAHEDDVKISRFNDKLATIPEKTGDPKLIRARKKLLKKKPKRSPNRQYWNEKQFSRLIDAPAGDLVSRGDIPWRLLAYLLSESPEVKRLHDFVDGRLLGPKACEAAHGRLDEMLKTLWAGGFVELDPEPPGRNEENVAEEPVASSGTFGALLAEAVAESLGTTGAGSNNEVVEESRGYRAEWARPTDRLEMLVGFRSIHPLYGAFLRDHLGSASRVEWIQALESTLEFPGSALRSVRVPGPERVAQGPLAIEKLHPELLQRGLATAAELGSEPDEDEFGERIWPLRLAEKLKLLFDSQYPGAGRLRISALWAAGAIDELGGDFNKVVGVCDLGRQEGVLFRHLLRFILLLQEFAAAPPFDADPHAWTDELTDLAEVLTRSCQAVDPQSTDQFLEETRTRDPLGEMWREGRG
ncbi:MAG: DEAD/DEAH box helicase [Planctomycetota bacterium]|nr:DEAD/DEAH box helicase [Planctomycetota bacterium]